MPESYEPDLAPGQSIWCLEKGNGVIKSIDYANRLVNCDFYEKGWKQFDITDLPSNWDDKLQQWVLAPL